MLEAFAGARRVERCAGRRVVQHLLLSLAYAGEQAQVVGQRMVFGELGQTLAAQGEQIARRQVGEGWFAGSGFDLPGL